MASLLLPSGFSTKCRRFKHQICQRNGRNFFIQHGIKLACSDLFRLVLIKLLPSQIDIFVRKPVPNSGHKCRAERMVFPSHVRIETELCRRLIIAKRLWSFPSCVTKHEIWSLVNRTKDQFLLRVRVKLHSPLLNKIAWNLLGLALDGVPICPN